MFQIFRKGSNPDILLYRSTKIDFRFPNINYTSKDDSKQLDLFVKYTKDLDKLRNENVLNYCPELKELFE